VYRHRGGYLLYLVGTDFLGISDGPVTVTINQSLNAKYAEDFVTGDRIEVKDSKITANIPGGVIQVLYVTTQ